MRGNLRSLLVGLGFFLCAPVSAQESPVTEMEGELPEAVVTATRESNLTSIVVYDLDRSDELRKLTPALSLDEVLSELPGLFVSDRGNATLGERISIRGMGWRAAFGVRGVQILLDGIPLTMPDGQAVADIVSPSMIKRAELLNGPSSLFWGNGSGGVLNLSTATYADSLLSARFRAMGGSNGLRQFNLESGTKIGRNSLQLFVSDDRRDGYRKYSNNRFTRAALNGRFPVGSRSVLSVTTAFAYQDAQNPGSLTLDQFNEDPQLANARNVSTLAGKKSLQLQAGATLLTTTNAGDLSITAYGLSRDLDNPLSFAYIDLNRNALGLRTALKKSTGRIDWGVGMDLGIQDDDRLNFDNDGGNPGTALSLAQDEFVRNFSVYGFFNAQISGPFYFTAGLRNDQVRFEMDDRFLDNGDQSGDRTFSALSPGVGFSFKEEDLLIYTNYRSAFETPTTTELVNRPDLDGGFNPDVKPQTVQGFEVGVRNHLPWWNIEYDVAFYSMNVHDLLVPFQTEAGGDRTFYRNGGRNLHRGMEVSARSKPLPWLALMLTHTTGSFEFRDSDLSGNSLPGLPNNRTHIKGTAESNDLWLQLAFEHVSSFYADDANSAVNDAYAVFDITIGHKGLKVQTLTFSPFFSVQNLTDLTYSSSVVVNAFGSRYFEPAAGRTFQFGVNVGV